MVVLYHYSVRYGEIYHYVVDPFFSFNYGLFGVHLFFIISGFVIFLTIEKTTHTIDFIVKRFSRLYPAYWFAVLLTFSSVNIFSLPGREVSFQTALINLSMVQKWFHVRSVDGVYWTLAVELSFYFIMSFLLLTKQTKNIEIVSIVWLATIVLLEFLQVNYASTIHWVLDLMLLLNHGHLFISGIMFYKLMHENKNNFFHYAIIVASLLTEYYLHGRIGLYVIAIYFFVFLLFVKGYLKIIATKPLIYLGTISYSLYLIHQNIGYVIIQKLESNDLVNPVSIIIVPLFIVITLACLMQKYIEKPALNLIRGKWKQSSFYKYLMKNSQSKL